MNTTPRDCLVDVSLFSNGNNMYSNRNLGLNHDSWGDIRKYVGFSCTL